MACAIQILTASGTSLPQKATANTVTIGGTAQECAEVNVTISCGQSKTKTASVGSNGSWAVTFDTSTLGCTCGQNISVSVYCVEHPNCFAERTFDLPCTACPHVDDINIIIHLDPLPEPLCLDDPVPDVTVTLTAMGAPGAGQYEWHFGDATASEETTVPSVSHRYDLPGPYNIKVIYRPTKAGCPVTEANQTLYVPPCDVIIEGGGPEIPTETDVRPKKPGKRPVGIIEETDVPTDRKKPNGGGGGGRLSCDALLVAAIGMMLVGGLGIAIAVCAKILLAGIVAGAVAAVGVALFFVWLAICGKITSCDVMRKMHWMLRMIVLLGVPIGVLAGGAQAGGGLNLDGWCWAALLGYYGSSAWLKDRLETIMLDAGCPPTARF
jgi:hypothetical protein